jgi:hypothetical protein
METAASSKPAKRHRPTRQMSLHHIGIVHGSKINASAKPRIGIAVRYITPDVLQEGKDRALAMLVRGADDYGHFELVDAPERDAPSTGDLLPKAVERMMRSVMPQGSPLRKA